MSDQRDEGPSATRSVEHLLKSIEERDSEARTVQSFWVTTGLNWVLMEAIFKHTRTCDLMVSQGIQWRHVCIERPGDTGDVESGNLHCARDAQKLGDS